MERLCRRGLAWVLLCIAISAVWGTALARIGSEWTDFRAVYAGTRCLMHGHNPYNVSDQEREYLSEDGPRPPANYRNLQAINLCVNLPTSFIILAPFAVLAWGPSHVLWMLIAGSAFTLAVLCIWHAGARFSPRVSTVLTCILAINCESIFNSGNTGGLVVGLCGIAVWCFLENQFVRIGVLCLAVALAIKPHDAGFIWLYFILAGSANRKRALQSVAITAAMSLIAVLWISHVAPTWMHDWTANLAKTSAYGGINDPGPTGIDHGVPIVDLQSIVSIFRNDPRFYNTASYLFCGSLLVLWSIQSFRRRFSVRMAWFALAAVVPLTLLTTYHRPWDAKLIILAVPACCMLWTEGGAIAKTSAWITFIAILFTGEISYVIFEMTAGSIHVDADGSLETFLTILLNRPASVALLSMGIFYLWVYQRRSDAREAPPASSGSEPRRLREAESGLL